MYLRYTTFSIIEKKPLHMLIIMVFLVTKIFPRLRSLPSIVMVTIWLVFRHSLEECLSAGCIHFFCPLNLLQPFLFLHYLNKWRKSMLDHHFPLKTCDIWLHLCVTKAGLLSHPFPFGYCTQNCRCHKPASVQRLSFNRQGQVVIAPKNWISINYP